MIMEENMGDDKHNSSILKEECEDYDQSFLSFSLLPAVFVILLLSFVQQRKNRFFFEPRSSCLSGRFGIVVPVDFASTLENRWSYAFAFGAVAQHMVSLIFKFSDPLPFTLPSYLQVFAYLAAAVKVGVACMPLFACLSTSHQLLGGILGLLYSVFWFSMQMWELIWCQDSEVDKGGIRDFLMDHEWLLDFPNLLSLGFLVCRFGFQIVKEILIRMNKLKRQEELTKEYYKYVQRLLQRPVSVQKNWFQRKVYDWDSYFKFPNRIIATVVLSFLMLYMIILLEQVLSSFLIIMMYDKPEDEDDEIVSVLSIFIDIDFTKHRDYFTYTWYVSSAFAALTSAINISRVLVYYRKHIKSMWAGQKVYLLRKYNPGPTNNLGGLLKYPGYQIAFTLWGYLLVHLTMFVGGLVFVYMVISPIRENGFMHWFSGVLIFLANFFVVLALMKLQQVVLHMFFLQDKVSPMDKDKPLALNNRRAFHNINYFLFFFNVILGIVSCMMRLMKSTAMGLILLSRIERAIMPQGFEKMDKCYCTWLGMIIADHHHSNPVLLCFCHLMMKKKQHGIEMDEEIQLNSVSIVTACGGVIRILRGKPPQHALNASQPNSSYHPICFPDPAVKARARTRWLLTYTLVRNPKLVLMRKHPNHCIKDAEFAMAWAISNNA